MKFIPPRSRQAVALMIIVLLVVLGGSGALISTLVQHSNGSSGGGTTQEGSNGVHPIGSGTDTETNTGELTDNNNDLSDAGGNSPVGSVLQQGGTSQVSQNSASSQSDMGAATASSSGSGSSGSPSPSSSVVVTKHFTNNTAGYSSAAAVLGFNVFDVSGSKTNPSSVNTTINAFPSGAYALVWLGNIGNAATGSPCPEPGYSDAQFQAQVDALAGNSKVFGYYISDEPHPSVCPNAAVDIKARTDYIHMNAPGQKVFIIVQDGSSMCGANLGCEFAAFKPSVTGVDLIGVDPYPCHYDSHGVAVACDNTAITTKVNSAIANGVPVSAIVPVYQTFGQEGRTDGKTVFYRTPSAAELISMLGTWSSLVPNPVMDYSYSWGVQCSSSCPAPMALSNLPELQSVISDFFD